MTTIAWRGEVLAADSALTHGTVRGIFNKTLRTRGAAYGFAGDVAAIKAASKMLLAGIPLDRIKVKGDFEALMLRPDGCYFTQKGSEPFLWPGEYWAIGSGAEVALGAMYAGLSARQAVEAAILHDSGSQGPVVWHRVRRRA